MTTTKPYPSWICHPCGIRFGRREPHCATFHDGHCDVCGTNAAVTQPRDYGHLMDGWKEMSETFCETCGSRYEICLGCMKCAASEMGQKVMQAELQSAADIYSAIQALVSIIKADNEYFAASRKLALLKVRGPVDDGAYQNASELFERAIGLRAELYEKYGESQLIPDLR